MNNKNMTLAVAAGAVGAIAVGFFFLGEGRAEASPADGRARAAGKPAVKPSAAKSPRAKGAVAAGRRIEQSAVAVTAPAADPVAAKARDLLARLQVAAGSGYNLPEDLQRDILAFLEEGDAHRTAFFSLAWDPSTPRLTLGHLRVFLMNIKDEGTRRDLLAAFDAFDPQAAEKAAVAARAKDPAVFVADLRAAPTAKVRADLMRKIPREAWTNPEISAWLLEAARDDADEDVRGTAYGLLAFGGNPEARAVIENATGDSGRSVTERKRAAFALAQIPGKRSVEELLRLYENAPDEVRRNLLPLFAAAPADRRVDDLLLDLLAGTGTSDKTRKSAAIALQSRFGVLTHAEARDLGTRTGEVLKGLDATKAAEAIQSLTGAVCVNEPLREAVRDLERTAPPGGTLQVALVSTPALRYALGRN